MSANTPAKTTAKTTAATALSPLRRLGLTIVAVAASATLVTACGSSTDGNPVLGGGSTGGASTAVSAPSDTSGGGASGGAAASSAVPSASAPSVSASAGGGSGGSKEAFCQQLQSLGSDLGSSMSGGLSAAKELAAKFQKLADSAPSEIKPDVQKMASYLESISSGTVPDASKTEEYSAAAQRVVKYLTSACI